MNLNYAKPDFYSRKAKDEGYVARSVYKLKEINEKFNLIKKNQHVLDLGSAPGSWAQYVSGIVGSSGRLVGVDYKEIKVAMPNTTFLVGNFFSDEIRQQLENLGPYDGIISDMAPDTVGDRVRDCFRSSDLTWKSLDFSYGFLKQGGYFICKIFQGGEEKEIMNEMKKAFTEAHWFKPDSSRKISFEIFLVGVGFIGKPQNDQAESEYQKFLSETENNDGSMMW